MKKTRRNSTASLLLIALMALGMASGCAKKLGGYDRNGPLNRFGNNDEDGLCTSDGTFADVPGYEEGTVNVYPDDTNNSAGEFTLTPTFNGDTFQMRRTGTPAQFAGLTYISPNIYQTGNIISGEMAEVRIILFSTCSTQDRPIYRVLSSGSQETFALGNIPTNGSLNVTVDPYLYDAVIVEYVGEAATVPGQAGIGQIIPPLGSTVWSYGCLHDGGYCY